MGMKGASVKIRLLEESDLNAVRDLTAGSQGLTMDRDPVYWLFSELTIKFSEKKSNAQYRLRLY